MRPRMMMIKVIMITGTLASFSPWDAFVVVIFLLSWPGRTIRHWPNAALKENGCHRGANEVATLCLSRSPRLLLLLLLLLLLPQQWHSTMKNHHSGGTCLWYKLNDQGNVLDQGRRRRRPLAFDPIGFPGRAHPTVYHGGGGPGAQQGNGVVVVVVVVVMTLLPAFVKTMTVTA